MKRSLLQRVVRGLHAATIISLRANEQQSILDFPLPDFSNWKFPDDGPVGDDGWTIGKRHYLYKELSAFLQNLLAGFHKAAQPIGQKYNKPTTIPSLIVGCIKLLNGDVPPEFQRDLSFFIIMMWRNDPGVFDTGPSVARALVTSIAEFVANSAQDTRDRSDKIVIQLQTIANGPKHLTYWHQIHSETIASLYAGPVKDDPKCFSGYIHTIAAALEAVISRESYPGMSGEGVFTFTRVWRSIVPTSFFTDRLPFEYSRDHPDCRLPYVYSLAIVISCGMRRAGHDPLEVLLLFSTSDGQKGNAAVGRILDTNILVVTILRRALSRVLTEAELRRDYLDPVTQALEPLEGIIEDRETYSWRT